MWDMQSYHEAQEDRYGKNYKSVKTLVRYGCKDETRGIVSLVHYSKEHGSGDVVFTGAVKKNEIEDVPIVPGSAAEHVWRIVCKHR
jgi:hypothetical protein